MAETKARFLADTQKADTTAEAFTWPTGRASTNNYVLAMDNISTGSTTWQVTSTAPTITGITSGQLNSYHDADGTTISNDKGGTLVIAGTEFGTDISSITAVRICASDGTSQVSATTVGSLSDTSITATWDGTESGYSSFSGVYHIEMVKSGLLSNRFNSTKSFSGDPTISSVTGTGGEGDNVTVTASNLGSYGGSIAGGGQDSNTKLLLNFDRSGGTDIEDSSNTGGDGHKITATGNAVIKASPFGDGKSAMFFDGTDDKLVTATSADFNLSGGEEFTIEFWIYPTATTGNILAIKSGNNAGRGLEISTVSNRLYTNISPDNTNWSILDSYLTDAGVYKAGEWQHIAVTMSRGETGYDYGRYRFFHNGVLVKDSGPASATSFMSGSASHFIILGQGFNDSGTFFGGYIDEFRYIKGTTSNGSGAIYTSNFTPPTSRLTAITNTKLLIHSDLYGEKVNGTATTLLGTSYFQARGPSGLVTSSFRANGSGAGLEVIGKRTVANSLFDITTGEFTIDFWVRRRHDHTGGARLFSGFATDTFEGPVLYMNSSEQLLFYWSEAGSSWNVNNGTLSEGTFDMANDTWYHMAIVREGTGTNNVKLYVDAVLRHQQTANQTVYFPANNGGIQFGRDGNNGSYLNGNIMNFRISNTSRYTNDAKGDLNNSGTIIKPSSTYTGNFTGTGGGLDQYTKCWVPCDNFIFSDSATSGTTHTITPTGSYHSQGHGGIATAMAWPASGKLTGSAGVYFDGTADYLNVPDHADLQWGSDSFSIDFWMYLDSLPSGSSGNNGYMIMFNGNDAGSTVNWELQLDASVGLMWSGSGGFSGANEGNMNDWQAHRWYHIAISRNGISTFKVYRDGVRIIAQTSSLSASSGSNYGIKIGGYTTTVNNAYNTTGFHGYLDSIRMQKGVVAFTGDDTSSANFTVPTKIYGAMFPTNPSVGTITITGATTDSTDIAFTEISSSLPNGLTLNDQGAGNQTATITGTLTDAVSSDTTTNNIRIQAKANADDKRITEVNESNSVGAVSITKKSGGKPVLFNARRYVGKGTDGPSAISGFGFQPDLVWAKARTANYQHGIWDSVRGVTKHLRADTTQIETTDANGLTEFTSDGFKTGVDTSTENINGGQDYVAWAWKAGTSFTPTTAGSGYSGHTGSKNTAGGFSIVKLTCPTGTTDNQTVTHGLTQAPDFIIGKTLGHTYNWDVYHKDLSSNNKRLILNSDDDESDYASGGWNVSSANFNTGGSTQHGDNTSVIYYCFHSVSDVSAFGTYTGNGGSSTNTNNGINAIGCKPRFLMSKAIDAAYPWMIFDSFREETANKDNYLRADDNAAEEGSSSVHDINFTSTGFSLGTATTGTWTNENSKNYIYAAFA